MADQNHPHENESPWNLADEVHQRKAWYDLYGDWLYFLRKRRRRIVSKNWMKQKFIGSEDVSQGQGVKGRMIPFFKKHDINTGLQEYLNTPIGIRDIIRIDEDCL